MPAQHIAPLEPSIPVLFANPISAKRNDVAASLLLEVTSVTPIQTNHEVFALFDQSPALVGLPVVEKGQPIGLINRNIFMDSFARPFHRDVYGNKSCIAVMDKRPLIVDGYV